MCSLGNIFFIYNEVKEAVLGITENGSAVAKNKHLYFILRNYLYNEWFSLMMKNTNSVASLFKR